MNLQGLFKFVKSSGSKKYERLFLLSEKFIYKLESYSITSFQWAVAIEAIHTIKLHKTNKFLIKICVKSSVNKKVINEKKFPINSKDEYEFIFKYDTDLKELIFQLKKLIYNINNSKTLVKLEYF